MIHFHVLCIDCDANDPAIGIGSAGQPLARSNPASSASTSTAFHATAVRNADDQRFRARCFRLCQSHVGLAACHLQLADDIVWPPVPDALSDLCNKSIGRVAKEKQVLGFDDGRGSGVASLRILRRFRREWRGICGAKSGERGNKRWFSN